MIRSRPSEPLLAVTNLSKDFEARRIPLIGERSVTQAVDNVSFSVNEGEAFGLVGESGSGKTTIGRMVIRLVRPTSGSILFRGESIEEMRGHRLLAYRRAVQMIFQSSSGQFNPRRRIRDVIADGMKIHHLAGGKELEPRLATLMAKVGLSDEMLDRYPHQFSGGQRQRIGIARALAVDPELVIADEPVSALDVSVQAQVLNVLRGLQRDLGLASVFISHDHVPLHSSAIGSASSIWAASWRSGIGMHSCRGLPTRTPRRSSPPCRLCPGSKWQQVRRLPVTSPTRHRTGAAASLRLGASCARGSGTPERLRDRAADATACSEWHRGGLPFRRPIESSVARLRDVVNPWNLTQIAGDHPRLFMTPADLPRLRSARFQPSRAPIWENLRAAAKVAAARPLRSNWIAPAADDPIYANLYERFYAMMADMAVIEHLAFVAVLGDEPDMVDAARGHLLATARAWAPEVEVQPDYGTAYAVTRLMKGLAVGYDFLYNRLDDAERGELRSFIVRLADRYVSGWFRQPEVLGPGAHTHHAHVEWGSLGITALALLGDVPASGDWLGLALTKFDQDLLPHGLAPDGAQVEGSSFWASTMQYRLMFMDAVRRVTGVDLFARHEGTMSADISLAAIATIRRGSSDEPSSSVLLEPGYAQLGYHAPVLEGLARFYRRPHLRYIAEWDELAGALLDADHQTPGGESLLFGLGPYSYLWRDETVDAIPGPHPLTARFDSVDEAYLRASWLPGDAIVGAKHGRLVVNLSGRIALADLEPENVIDREASTLAGTAIWCWQPPALVQELQEIGISSKGSVATWINRAAGTRTRAEVKPGRVRIERAGAARRSWWCARGASRVDDTTIAIPGAPSVVVTIARGVLESFDPGGYAPSREVGYQSLKLISRDVGVWPLVSVRPDKDGLLAVEIRADSGAPSRPRPVSGNRSAT